jgi:hypothetical protein
MTPRRAIAAAIGTPIVATSIIQLANGFFTTFISLRVALEEFGPTMTGLVLSANLAGSWPKVWSGAATTVRRRGERRQ